MPSGYASIEDLRPLVDAMHPPDDISQSTRFSEAVVQLCSGPAKLSVLDAGCGRADLRQPIRQLGHDYVGLDIENPAADVQGSVTALPFARQAFDLILCRSVLQYTLEPLTALRELNRTLSRSGTLFCEVPFLEPWVWGSKLHYSPAGIVLLAREAGFRVRHIWPGWQVAEAVAEAARQAGISQVLSEENWTATPSLEFAASLLLLCTPQQP